MYFGQAACRMFPDQALNLGFIVKVLHLNHQATREPPLATFYVVNSHTCLPYFPVPIEDVSVISESSTGQCGFRGEDGENKSAKENEKGRGGCAILETNWKRMSQRRHLFPEPNATMLNHVQLFVTVLTVARQTPLSMGFPRQEDWSGLPFSPPGNLPNPRSNLYVLHHLHWQGRSLPLHSLGSPDNMLCNMLCYLVPQQPLSFHSIVVMNILVQISNCFCVLVSWIYI